MILKEAEPKEFFQHGEKSIITESIHKAGEASLAETLARLKLSKTDWVISGMGRKLVLPTAQVKVIEGIMDISAKLEDEHIVETRGIGIGRRVTPKVSVVDEILTPHPSRILATNEDVIQTIKKAVEKDDREAVSTLREIERKGSIRDIVFNKDVSSVDELLGRDWELISSRERTRLTGKLKKRVRSLDPEKLILDLHTHDKVVPESDVPSTRDYISIRVRYKFDWFALCRATNIESLKSPNLMEDVVFFYSGKGSEPYLGKIREASKIQDERKRSNALYELRFEIYQSLKADTCTYGEMVG
ncbi:MAG: hypothetical protein Sv326_0729 [Candidatus Fermentimicrarchaeum limneticum]|uniref:Uncharacterized protein n=1 Tax=Fermentimicrarchaeum limneticum TaxID=2795018 RepID=A0A7D6BV13_FERL1|nr:MAG: hypothetical protein Sv326_0729 [Candidatus Fermentimicrarchaeum limneticum]